MADIATPLGALPAAPASTDNQTVILWVVAVLMVGICVAVAMLWRVMRENASKCLEEAAKSKAEIVDAHRRIEQMHVGVVHEQHNTQAQSNAVMERVAQAMERNNQVIADNTAVMRGIGSGAYRTVRHS